MCRHKKQTKCKLTKCYLNATVYLFRTGEHDHDTSVYCIYYLNEYIEDGLRILTTLISR